MILTTHNLILRFGMVIAITLSFGCLLTAQESPSSLQNSNAPGKPTPPTQKEQKVKAAYIYNFSRYFEWPKQSFSNENASFVIGVLGIDPLGNQLDILARKKTVRNRKIVIRRFETVDEYERCQLLFITRSVSDDQFKLVVEKANSEHVLVVSEKPPSTRQGSSVLIFIGKAGKVGFEIDVGVVAARSLLVSAKLLKLASVSDSSTK